MVKILILTKKSESHTFYNKLSDGSETNYLFLNNKSKKKQWKLPKLLEVFSLDFIFMRLFYVKRIFYNAFINQIKFWKKDYNFIYSKLSNKIKNLKSYKEADIIYIPHNSKVLDGIEKPFIKEIEYFFSPSCMELLLTKKSLNKEIKILENFYKNKNLKFIVCYFQIIKDSLIKNGFHEISEKIIVVPPASQLANDLKNKPIYENDCLNVLFLASSNYNMTIYERGILEAIEILKLINKKDKIRFYLRIKPTKTLRKKLSKINKDSYVLIDKYLSDKELSNLYYKCDVMFLPAYVSLYVSFTEAMSYGLPILTINKQGNKELVDNGKTGYVIDSDPQTISYKGFKDSLYDTYPHKPKKEVVKKFYDLLKMLRKDKKCLIKLRNNCIKEVKSGKFSFEKRDKLLSKLYLDSIK